jgi:hypothetical protein
VYGIRGPLMTTEHGSRSLSEDGQHTQYACSSWIDNELGYATSLLSVHRRGDELWRMAPLHATSDESRLVNLLRFCREQVRPPMLEQLALRNFHPSYSYIAARSNVAGMYPIFHRTHGRSETRILWYAGQDKATRTS